MLGRISSLNAAKKIANAFGITLDYLAGETNDMAFDRRTAETFQDIEKHHRKRKGTRICAARCIPRQEQDAGDTKIRLVIP
jgi:hypothetical protein